MKPLPYESLGQPLLPFGRFLRRMVNHFTFVAGVLGGSLLIGMAGYTYFERLQWRDAFLNSAMLLAGMGPVDPPHTNGGKLFAGVYALYSGLIFLISAGFLFAPFAHRLLHRFHMDDAGDQ